MAVGVANVTSPNYASADYTLGPFKLKVRRITFDSSYPTGGEVVLASQVGLQNIVMVLPTVASNAAGTLGYPLFGKPNSTGSQCALLPLASGANAGDPLPEETNAADLALFSADVWFVGH